MLPPPRPAPVSPVVAMAVVAPSHPSVALPPSRCPSSAPVLPSVAPPRCACFAASSISVRLRPRARPLCPRAPALPPAAFSPPSAPSASFHPAAPPPPLPPAPAPSPPFQFGDSSRWLNSRMIRGVLVAAPLIFGALFGNAIASAAAEHSIGSSSLGLKVASFLRGSGLSDEVIVAAIASLPALELRGAIPVGYWMTLPPEKTYVLAVFGNMIPVPFIALYLEKLFSYIASSSQGGKKLVDKLITNTRRKAEPIEEFKWIGLMLFVAVPFPGTGAWTGAFAASILGMTVWESISANFVGVLLAGVLVNLIVSVGIREAVFVGVALFLLSMFMWRILRFFNQKKASDA